MKKILTIALIAVLTIVGQTAMAQGNKNAQSKRPEFVNEKHRAHAEWKREKEYAKADKKYNKKKNKHKHDHDDDDRWERDRRHDDDRRDFPWEKTVEQRRAEERARRRAEEQRRDEENRPPRTIRDVILKRTGDVN
jgi:hypothetical protein